MKNQKGITLIALIITIIVLAILAAVSITSLTGKNGVITESLQTSEDTEIADEEEKVTVAYMGAAMKNHGYGTTVDALQKELDETVGAGKTEVTEENGKLNVKFVDTGRTYVAGDVYSGEASNGIVYLNPDEWEYTVDTTTNTATLTKYKIAGATEVTIPNYIKTDNGNIPVKKVVGSYNGGSGTSVWSDATGGIYYPLQTTIERIIVSEGIEELSNSAFCGTTKLKEIILPGSLIILGGENLFLDCDSLANITIPNGVTSIGDGAFLNCDGLTNITIPDSVTSIGASAFSECRGLTNITIPDSVTSIGASAFYYCTGLTNIIIPDSVTSIGASAFYYCTGLTNITIPNNVTSIGGLRLQVVED